MKSKKIEFKQDADTLLKRAEQCELKGDFPSALSYLFRVQKLKPNNLDITLDIANIYGKMDILELKLKYLVKLLRFGRSDELLYKELVHCYLSQDMFRQALHYYREGLEIGVFEYDVIEEYFEDNNCVYEEVSGPEIKDKRDKQDVLLFSKNLMKNGNFEFARQLLETIPKESYQYTEANISLASIALSNDNPKLCLDYLLSVFDIEKNSEDENVLILSNMILSYELLKDKANVEKYTDYLLELDIQEIRNMRNAAFCMLRTSNHKLARVFCERALVGYPYLNELLISSAIVNFNCGKFSRAKELLVRAQNIYPDDVTIKYYAKHLFANKDKRDWLTLPIVPESVIIEWQESLHAFIDSYRSGQIKAHEISEEMKDRIKWTYQMDDVPLQSTFANLLVENYEWEMYIRDLLIDPTYTSISKKGILYALLKVCKNKNFDIFTNDSYIKFTPKMPRGDFEPAFTCAYWMVYATLAMLIDDFDSRLNRCFKEMIRAYYNQETPPLPFEFNHRTLAALLLYRLNIAPFFNDKTDCCNVYACDLSDFEAYDDIFPKEAIRRNKRKKDTD